MEVVAKEAARTNLVTLNATTFKRTEDPAWMDGLIKLSFQRGDGQSIILALQFSNGKRTNISIPASDWNEIIGAMG